MASIRTPRGSHSISAPCAEPARRASRQPDRHPQPPRLRQKLSNRSGIRATIGVMPIDHRVMKSCVLGLALTLSACAVRNQGTCPDGICTDPARPFCDLDGAIEGKREVCIAVACTAGEFVACRDDHALSCNVQGADYDDTQCQKGCEPNVGCRVCDPGTSTCVNGVAQTCDAAGNVVASESCALGCFDATPKCRTVDPSNGLAMYLDLESSPPDVDIVDGEIDTLTGIVTDGPDHTVLQLPSFAVFAPSGGAPLRVFVVNTAHIKKLLIGSRNLPVDTVVPAFVLLARSDITLDGPITVSGGEMSVPGCNGGQGVRSSPFFCVIA